MLNVKYISCLFVISYLYARLITARIIQYEYCMLLKAHIYPCFDEMSRCFCVSFNTINVLVISSKQFHKKISIHTKCMIGLCVFKCECLCVCERERVLMCVCIHVFLYMHACVYEGVCVFVCCDCV